MNAMNSRGEPMRHIGHKLFVPYATPIGFNTQVQPKTEEAWRRISDLILLARYHPGPDRRPYAWRATTHPPIRRLSPA